MDIDRGIERLQLALVRGKVCRVEVAEVDGASTVVGILVGGGAANANWGICACVGIIMISIDF